MDTLEKLQRLKIQALQVMYLVLLDTSLTVSDVTKSIIWSAQSVQDILVTNHVGDPIWSHTNICDVSTSTVNIVEQLPEYILHRPDLIELLTIDAYVSPISIKDDRMYQFMNDYDE